MFILSNEDRNEILLKSDSGYVIHFGKDGKPDYPSVTSIDTAADALTLNLGSARDFDEKHQVKNFTGRISYRQRNAYGQLIYEGEIPADEKAVIVSLGDLIDMSDSTLVLVNLTADDAWKALLSIAQQHQTDVTDKNDRKTLDDFIRYASGKCGVTPPPEKKSGFLSGLFHRK